MQGDKRIDKLMLPVLNAINRHVKDRDAKTDIYNRAYEAVMISMVVKNEQRHIEFCPNCEADVPCTHEAELFVCDICGEDFAKYIVSRNCDHLNNSVTQNNVLNATIAQLTAERDAWKAYAERLAKTFVIEVYPHEWVCRSGCHHMGKSPATINHAPDCPITLHRQLVAKYGQVVDK
jgi:ribosomal protein L37AE/L43A